MSFTIDRDKLEEVTWVLNQQVDPGVTKEQVRTEICAYWNDAWHEHQEWIDTATIQEIVDWLASFCD